MSQPDSAEVYVDEPWLSISWDREHKCVYVEWKGFCTSVEFRTATMKILDAIRDRKAALLVSDNRRLEGVGMPDQLWIRDTWTPLAVAAGLRRIAVVLASHGLGKIASEEILSRNVDTEFVTSTFESLPEAMIWVAGGEKKAKEGDR